MVGSSPQAVPHWQRRVLQRLHARALIVDPIACSCTLFQKAHAALRVLRAQQGCCYGRDVMWWRRAARRHTRALGKHRLWTLRAWGHHSCLVGWLPIIRGADPWVMGAQAVGMAEDPHKGCPLQDRSAQVNRTAKAAVGTWKGP